MVKSQLLRKYYAQSDLFMMHLVSTKSTRLKEVYFQLVSFLTSYDHNVSEDQIAFLKIIAEYIGVDYVQLMLKSNEMDISQLEEFIVEIKSENVYLELILDALISSGIEGEFGEKELKMIGLVSNSLHMTAEDLSNIINISKVIISSTGERDEIILNKMDCTFYLKLLYNIGNDFKIIIGDIEFDNVVKIEENTLILNCREVTPKEKVIEIFGDVCVYILNSDLSNLSIETYGCSELRLDRCKLKDDVKLKLYACDKLIFNENMFLDFKGNKIYDEAYIKSSSSKSVVIKNNIFNDVSFGKIMDIYECGEVKVIKNKFIFNNSNIKEEDLNEYNSEELLIGSIWGCNFVEFNNNSCENIIAFSTPITFRDCKEVEFYRNRIANSIGFDNAGVDFDECGLVKCEKNHFYKIKTLNPLGEGAAVVCAKECEGSIRLNIFELCSYPKRDKMVELMDIFNISYDEYAFSDTYILSEKANVEKNEYINCTCHDIA